MKAYPHFLNIFSFSNVENELIRKSPIAVAESAH